MILTFHKRLAAYRAALGLTQYELDKKAGLCRGSVAQYETYRYPSVKTAIRLACAVGCTLDDLFETELWTLRPDDYVPGHLDQTKFPSSLYAYKGAENPGFFKKKPETCEENEDGTTTSNDHDQEGQP